jgi:diacylglycerol kinase (ATP)
VVNGNASGIDDPERTAVELKSVLDELDAPAETAITSDEADLFEALRGAVATERRVILVGGDGSLHDAANAPLGRLPELALVPAGRANNIARALGVPADRPRALAIAARAPARPLDVLRVETPERTLFALEGVSAGFQADARSGYEAENSSDLRQGAQALIKAVRGYAPFKLHARVNGEELVSDSAAQLFLSNLPYFGFGFEVDPGADPSDGRLEAILFEAPGRRQLLRLGAAAYRGRHLGHRGVSVVSSPEAELVDPLPLVADAVPLGTTTASVTVDSERLRIAAPAGGSS